MSEPTTEPGGDLTVAADPAPFLRITATYPVGDGRVQTVDVALNLRDEDPVLEVADEATPDTGVVTSWLGTFVAETIAAMRQRHLPSIVLSGKALTTVLADQVKHAETCNGECGIPMPTAADPTIPASAGGN